MKAPDIVPAAPVRTADGGRPASAQKSLAEVHGTIPVPKHFGFWRKLLTIAGPGHHPSFINSVTFAHDIIGKLGGYVKFFSAVSTETGARWVGTVDLGLTYGLTDHPRLDAGINLGVTDSADDLNPFIGLSWRF